ncbi:MAG: MBL fold metallo-hydrolase, partial [Smithella sp.]
MIDLKLKAVDKVEIITLQDNYIDITALDGNAVIERAPFQLKNSIIAEHGFSAIVKTTSNHEARTLLFDFGFSADGAARNASVLNVDMNKVEAAVLSHGHSDHTGGLEKLAAMVGKENIPFIIHPGVFKKSRYLKKSKDSRIEFPEFT